METIIIAVAVVVGIAAALVAGRSAQKWALVVFFTLVAWSVGFIASAHNSWEGHEVASAVFSALALALLVASLAGFARFLVAVIGALGVAYWYSAARRWRETALRCGNFGDLAEDCFANADRCAKNEEKWEKLLY